MYRKILVTGGYGTLGTALQSLVNDYPNFEFIFANSKDCNLTKIDPILSYFDEYKPDAVLHFAAVSGGVSYSIKYPATLLRDNLLMNLNVLEAGRICGVRKIVMTLSSGMYPADCPNPIKEEHIHTGAPHPSNYSYSFAKRLIEPSIKAYRTEYNLNIIGLIPNGIIGENSNYDLEAAIMPAALIRRFYENRGNDSKIVIWGDGSPLREITYAKDIARAFMWCLDNYDDEQILNVGTTEELSVKEIAFIIADTLGVDRKRIEFDPKRPAGQFRKNTDNSKFVGRSQFKYTPLKETLERVIYHFCQNYPDGIRL